MVLMPKKTGGKVRGEIGLSLRENRPPLIPLSMKESKTQTMVNIFHVLTASGWQQFHTSFARPMFRFCVIAQPIIFGLLLGLMYLKAPSQDFMLYAVLGSGLSAFWSSICFSSASDIARERWYGTLENIYAAPAGFRWIILGKILGNSLWGLVSIFISVMVVSVVYQRPIIIASVPWLIGGLALMTVSLVAIGFLLAGLFTLSRNARMLMNFMEYPVYILCGILFPVDLLPGFLQVFAYTLSPTWAVQILRYAILGGNQQVAWQQVYGLSLLTVVYGISAIYFFHQIDRRCRIDATLEVY